MANLAYRSPPVGGSVCLSEVQLPGMCVSAKESFQPHNYSGGHKFSIIPMIVPEIRSTIELSEHQSFHAINIRDSAETSTSEVSTSGRVFDYTLMQNPLHGTFNWRIRKEPFQDSETVPKEKDYIPIGNLCSLLDVCIKNNDIAGGRSMHLLITSNGFDFVPELVDDLIYLYALCGSFGEAYQMFSKLEVPRVTSWYAIMLAHSRHGDNKRVLQLYFRMTYAGITPNGSIFTCVVNSCTSLGALTEFEAILCDMVCFGLQLDLFIASALIDFYGKCGKLTNAYHTFLMVPEKNVVVWSAMIAAFIKEGCLEESLELFRHMEEQGVESNEFTYSILMNAFGKSSDLAQGMCLHDQFVRSGLHLDSGMASTILDMYSKCGCLMEALDVFDDLSNPTLVCWNTLIAGHVHNEQDHAALEFFDSMESEGYSPNGLTLSSGLKACGNLNALTRGQAIHKRIFLSGLESDEYIQSGLVDMYCKCGYLDEAQSVFDNWPSCNLVLWGALMAGYEQHGQHFSVLECFAKMKKDGIKPNVHIYSSILQACGNLRALEIGISVHEQICQSGLQICGILGYNLICMYVKCGHLETARALFDELPFPNVECWGALLAGYVQYGCPLAAFGLYEEMSSEGMRPNSIIYMYILEACGILGSSDRGKNIHVQVIESGFGSDIVVGNSLINMYIKCNCLKEAQNTFQLLNQRNIISWNAMAVAHSENGNFSTVRNCLQGMAEEGFMADGILFTDILVACRRSRNLDEGCTFFKLMKHVYGINPTIEHFGCIISLLGGGGYLLEAEELLELLPVPPDGIAWLSLLSACRAHRKVDLGFRCYNEVVNLDAGMGMAYVLMSSIFEQASMWEMKHKIDEQRKQSDVWKIPGRAWIEVDNQVHEFTVGDRTHPQRNEIHCTLRRLASVLKDDSNVPQLSVVDGAVDKDGGQEISYEEALLGHCERLAIAFGIFSTPEGATMRVVKNLRVCGDCHDFSKIVSRVEKRDIIINDAYHVHHFRDGECSCEKDLISG